jgi:integrase
MGRSQTETKALLKAIEKRRKAGRANFGTIDLLPSGRLRARFRGPDGKRHNAPHTFDTLLDADAYLLTIRQQIMTGTWLSPAEQQRADRVTAISGTTANELFEDYLEEGDLKQGTIDLYRYQWHRFIQDTIGALPVSDLTATDVADWRNRLPSGARQREQTEDLLRAVLGLAIERRLITFNPAARTRRKRKGRGTRAKARDTILLSPAEVAALAKAMPPERSFAVLISAWCGLRQGEMFALRRNDLTINRNPEGHIASATVSVTRSVVRSRQPDGSILAFEDDPKSDAGIRRVAVPPHILEDLDNHLQRFAQHGEDGLLFPNTSGGYLHPSTLYGEQPGTKRPDTRRTNPSKGSGFYRARAAIGQPQLTWHALRHHAVTRAVYAGATQAELLERYGHSNIASSAIYQHADQGRDHQIANAMSQLALQQPA